ncbi:MAG: HAD family hydrolase [Lachnospiraceae bacterium]|nr:HAD family hydrolase [Lachnospiraceae bacterium]
MRFIELKKLSRSDASALPELRCVLLGDCATQHLATALKGQAVAEGLRLELLDTDYDQLRAQITDPGSELYAHKPEAVILACCTERLYAAYHDTPAAERESFAENKLAELCAYWERLLSVPGLRVLQFSFPELDDGIYGDLAAQIKSSFLYQQRLLNLKLADAAAEHAGVFIIDIAALQGRIGRRALHDERLYASAKISFMPEALPFVAEKTVAMLRALKGYIKKCVVLDLDNTLWGGVVGDDGLEGIQIGELGSGHAFYDFQLWLKELKERGMLLAVCSKNDEDKAKEPFEKHPEMVLKLTDFAVFVANWEDKAGNIRHIRELLDLGLDSFVFIDDNPFERELVRSMLPEVTVPELPEDPALYVEYLSSLNLFETASHSAADAARTGQYRAEAARRSTQAEYADYDDYLKALEMQAECASFTPFHYPRIAQLSQRSNQFNLRTVRYTEEDIRRIAEDEQYSTIYFCLKDKFGDHGLISAVIMKREGEDFFIDTWIMSCRVLKRGMEEFIINKVMEEAAKAGAKRVIGEYLPTPKNGMVKEIYSKMGFTPEGEGRFIAECAGFTARKCYITATAPETQA